MKKRSLLVVAFSAALFVSSFGQIANHVVISEVSPMKGNSSTFNTGEFIELYNPTANDITLSAGAQIVSGNTSGSNAAEWQLSLSGKVIKAYGFFLISDAGLSPRDTSFLSNKNLANSGTRACVQLRDGSTVIDAFGWDPALAPLLSAEGNRVLPSSSSTDGKSFERKSSSSAVGPDTLGNGYDSDDNATNFFENSVSAANPQNSLSPSEHPYTGPDQSPPILLTARALSSSEVEVAFNEPVDSLTSSVVSNYLLDNSATVNGAARNSSNFSKVTLTVSMLTNGLYTVTVQNIKDTTGNSIASPQSKSFSFGVIPISLARSAGTGQSVKVRGVITVANEFGSPAFIQDTSGALAVFNSAFSASARLGDIWEIGGDLKNFNGLLEFDPLRDSTKISSGNPVPKPKILNSTQLNESVEGQLVRINKVKFAVTGTFGSGIDSTYTASDATGPLAIRIDRDSNVPGSPIPADSVNIVGIVNDFNGSYRLMPRSFADIGVRDPPPDQTWTDISIARNAGIGVPVKVRGVVTYNQPGSIIYIQDRTAGLALFDAKTDTLAEGDSVEAVGPLVQFSNLLEMQPVDTLRLLAKSLSVPAPKIVPLSQASEFFESQLIRINGVRFTTSGVFAGNTNYNISDGSKQLVVRIPTGTLLVGQSIPAGAIDIIGILGQFNASYQLIPRSAADLIALPGPQIVVPPNITVLTDNSFTVFWKTLLAGDTRIYFGMTSNLGDSLVVNESDTSHSVSISGLKSGRIYYYKVASTNGSGSSSSLAVPLVTTSSASTGQMLVYFNFSTDGTLGLQPVANGNTNLTTKLLERITAAKQSIDLALYSFDDFGSNPAVVAGTIADSLIAAKNRGIKLRVVFQNRTTTAALQKLISASISVLKRNVPETGSGMHNKFWVFDGRDTTSATDDWVISGSWNVTNSGTLVDAQNAVFIQDQSLARIYTVEFEEMFGSNTETANGTNAKFGPTKLDNTPHFTFVNGKKVESYFSPSDKTTSAIVRAINSANNNVFFGLFSFTRDEIGAEIIARKNAGVIVRGIIDNIGDAGSEYTPLLSATVDVRKAGHSVVTGDFHHKYGIVDPFHDASDPVVITGSHNWSSSAENDNDENTLIIHSGELARQFVQEFAKRYQESGGTGPILKVEQIGAVPDKMRLSQNYPNPFNPSTSINFQLPQRTFVTLSVFDVLGRQVATLLNEEKQAGSYRLTWDASWLPSGIYFCRMQTSSYSETRKMMLVK